jgi:DNA polymerase-4
VVRPGTEAAYLAPLPVSRLWGIGPKTQVRLEAAGIRTIGDVAALDDAEAFALFGRWGREARALARGIDDRLVDSFRERKSISTEETFEYDVRDEGRIVALLHAQADELARDLQVRTLRAATIGVKIKRADFQTIVRQTSLVVPTNAAAEIYAAALRCWQRTEMAGKPIRLLGTRVAALSEGATRELSLFGGD